MLLRDTSLICQFYPPGLIGLGILLKRSLQDLYLLIRERFVCGRAGSIQVVIRLQPEVCAEWYKVCTAADNVCISMINIIVITTTAGAGNSTGGIADIAEGF